MAKLDEVGTTDGWRCWLCDEPVEPGLGATSEVESGGGQYLVVLRA